jgi:hypothetical protein
MEKSERGPAREKSVLIAKSVMHLEEILIQNKEEVINIANIFEMYGLSQCGRPFSLFSPSGPLPFDQSGLISPPIYLGTLEDPSPG